jgi:hypothetical protein
MLTRIACYAARHHLAMLALFVALGGTSFAAAAAALPINSVGTKQVINGSLRTTDLSRTARNALKGSRGPEGPAGPQGAQGAQGAPGATGQPATKLFVAVNAGGAITKNSGATTAERAGTGAYRISFNADITNCVYIGTAGQDNDGVTGDYNLYASRTAAHTVNVVIADGQSNPLDRPFYLAVFC